MIKEKVKYYSEGEALGDLTPMSIFDPLKVIFSRFDVSGANHPRGKEGHGGRLTVSNKTTR